MRPWRRMDFGPMPPGNLQRHAEEETKRDLLKPIEQLLCDVHEEVHHPGRNASENGAAAIKRMTSLMARVAISNERASRQLLVLTWVLAIFTAAMLWLTYMLWVDSLQ